MAAAEGKNEAAERDEVLLLEHRKIGGRARVVHQDVDDRACREADPRRNALTTTTVNKNKCNGPILPRHQNLARVKHPHSQARLMHHLNRVRELDDERPQGALRDARRHRREAALRPPAAERRVSAPARSGGLHGCYGAGVRGGVWVGLAEVEVGDRLRVGMVGVDDDQSCVKVRNENAV